MWQFGHVEIASNLETIDVIDKACIAHQYDTMADCLVKGNFAPRCLPPFLT